MGLFRMVNLSFWTDSKVDDDFTPEDKYFYLYLLTNPHTNICGCYEISMKQMCRETGYNEDTINRLLKRMERQHGVIRYDPKTKEILVLKWGKYNWSKSSDTLKGVKKVAEYIKSPKFKTFVQGMIETPSWGCIESLETSYTYTSADTCSNTDTDSTDNKKQVKHKYGEYQNVLLTDREYEKLLEDYGNEKRQLAIQYLDEYIEDKPYKSKSHYLAIRRWVMDAVKEKITKMVKSPLEQRSWEEVAAEWEEEHG